jgi:hypothetical protein
MELRASSEDLMAALDLIPTGIVLLAEAGRIVLMNQRASQLLAKKDGLLETRNGLSAEIPEESRRLEELVLCVASPSETPSSLSGIVMVSRRTRPPLQVFVSPIVKPFLKMLRHASAVVHIKDPDQLDRPPDIVLKARYGLTTAESRVALLLGDGHPPAKLRRGPA